MVLKQATMNHSRSPSAYRNPLASRPLLYTGYVPYLRSRCAHCSCIRGHNTQQMLSKMNKQIGMVALANFDRKCSPLTPTTVAATEAPLTTKASMTAPTTVDAAKPLTTVLRKKPPQPVAAMKAPTAVVATEAPSLKEHPQPGKPARHHSRFSIKTQGNMMRNQEQGHKCTRKHEPHNPGQ